jgi:sulfate adenylyltransferase subunit 1
VPVSALRGDNIVDASDAMPWYQGEPLLPLLESLPVEDAHEGDAALRFPVQLVARQDGAQPTISAATWAASKRARCAWAKLRVLPANREPSWPKC